MQTPSDLVRAFLPSLGGAAANAEVVRYLASRRGGSPGDRGTVAAGMRSWLAHHPRYRERVRQEAEAAWSRMMPFPIPRAFAEQFEDEAMHPISSDAAASWVAAHPETARSFAGVVMGMAAAHQRPLSTQDADTIARRSLQAGSLAAALAEMARALDEIRPAPAARPARSPTPPPPPTPTTLLECVRARAESRGDVTPAAIHRAAECASSPATLLDLCVEAANGVTAGAPRFTRAFRTAVGRDPTANEYAAAVSAGLDAEGFLEAAERNRSGIDRAARALAGRDTTTSELAAITASLILSEGALPPDRAEDLARSFLTARRDLATDATERLVAEIPERVAERLEALYGGADAAAAPIAALAAAHVRRDGASAAEAAARASGTYARLARAVRAAFEGEGEVAVDADVHAHITDGARLSGDIRWLRETARVADLEGAAGSAPAARRVLRAMLRWARGDAAPDAIARSFAVGAKFAMDQIDDSSPGTPTR